MFYLTFLLTLSPSAISPVKSLELDFATRSGCKFVVSRAGEAYDAQASGLNPKFRLRDL